MIGEPIAVAYLRKRKLLMLGFSLSEIKEMSLKERKTWELISDLEARAVKKKRLENSMR